MEIDRLISLISFFEKRAQAQAQATSNAVIPDAWLSLYSSLKEVFKIKINEEDFNEWLLLNFAKLHLALGSEWKLYSPGALCAKTQNGFCILHSPEFDIENMYRMRHVLNDWRLYPTSKIPTYEFVYFSNKINTLTEEHPIIADYVFILKALSDIDFVKNFKKEAKEFIENNLEKLKQLKGSFQQLPQYLGGKGVPSKDGGKGPTDGVVFKVGDNLVLKIFRDNYTYLHAKNIMSKMHPTNKTRDDKTDTVPSVNVQELYKTEAMIYDVGILGEWGGKPLYYYLMEQMTPSDKIVPLNEPIEDSAIQKSLSHLVRFIGKDAERNDGLKVVHKLIRSKNNSNSKAVKDFIKEEVRKYVENIADDMKYNGYCVESINYINSNIGIVTPLDKSNQSSKLKSNWTKLLAEEVVMKYLSGRTDIHAGNIGLTNYGEFRYFDPAFDQENLLNV